MKIGGAKSIRQAALSSHGQAERPLVGASSQFLQVLSVINAVADHDCLVLIEGESGTGKELLARRLHERSCRREFPFIPVNCPGFTESLFESQFFGHTRGAFTGAATDSLGAVRAAEGGTLLLDEVGELPLHLQSKLLRLLQEREVTPVGASTPVPVNVRFVASTNRNLARMVSERTFRADLYHRLNIVRIEVPPLRNRQEDVEPLLDYYLALFARRYAMPPRELSPRLRRILVEYPWPGNVRELCAYIERLYAANLPPMPPSVFQWDDGYGSPSVNMSSPASAPMPVGRMGMGDHTPVCCSLAEAEAEAIRRAMESCGYNRSAASKLLAIHRSTLSRKLRDLGMDGRRGR